LKEPPAMIGVILGDVVNNVRSALDHLACQFVIHSGNKPTRSTAFPIMTENPKLDAGTKRYWERSTDGMSVDIKTLLDGPQPYQGGDDAGPKFLAILAALSNWDKHRDIHVIGHAHLGSNFDIIGSVGIALTEINPSSGLKNGAEVARWRVVGGEPGAISKMNVEIMLSIAIDNPAQTLLHGINPVHISTELPAYVTTTIVDQIANIFPVIR